MENATIIFNPDDVFKAFMEREEWACDVISNLGNDAAERNDLDWLVEQLTDFFGRTEKKYPMKDVIKMILVAGYSMGGYQTEVRHLQKGR